MRFSTSSIAFAGMASVASAYPQLAAMAGQVQKRDLPLSQNENNCGVVDCVTFSASEQYVDVSAGSANAFVAPTSTDTRGPCPGLNAAANHGFFPHDGIVTLAQTISGLAAAYGFGDDFSAALAVVAIALTGDPTTEQWSVGGPFTPGLLDGLLSDPDGISYSHNAYESDASPARYDAYLNNGDAHSLNLPRFADLLSMADENGEFSIDVLRTHNEKVWHESLDTNPYFFSAPFAGLVPPIAHHFIINLMSNHSAENPNGFLTKDVLKSFFSVSGPDDALVWTPGHEQIPANWYRRPSDNPYGAVAAVADVGVLATRYPDIIAIGGNTGTTDSFVGVDVCALSGCSYNATSILEGNNLGCFAFQAVQQIIPSVLVGLVTDITSVVQLVADNVDPMLSTLGCPQLTKYDDSSLQQFPGYKYKVTVPKPAPGM